MESALRQRRLGRAGRWPGVPTLVPLLLLAPVFSAPALIILQPVFTDAGVAADLLGGGSSARLQLSVVSSAFFAVWGPGTLVLSALSDFVGRKPVLLGCAAMTSILTLAGSLTPNFLVYATCRTLLGITCGAQGAVSFLHAVEWGLPKDNGLLTCVLMSSWSFFGMILASVGRPLPSPARASSRILKTQMHDLLWFACWSARLPMLNGGRTRALFISTATLPARSVADRCFSPFGVSHNLAVRAARPLLDQRRSPAVRPPRTRITPIAHVP
eukprot:scaffold247337_cov32-Tisochrysis_lutea.AAC.1